MIKKPIIIFLFFLSNNLVYSQYTFQHIFRSPLHQNIGNIIEAANGDIIFPIITANPPESKIMKLDKEGNLIDSTIISSVPNCIFTVYKYNDAFFFAAGFWVVDNKFNYWIQKYDYDFQLIKELSLPISGFSNLLSNPILVNSKNNLVISFTSDSTAYIANTYILEISTDLVILKHKKYLVDNFTYPNEIIQKDSLYYVFFGGLLQKVYNCQIYKLDSTFNIYNHYNINGNYILDNNNAKWINDSIIVLSGRIDLNVDNNSVQRILTKIVTMRVDTCLHPIKEKLFIRHDSNNFIGWKKNMDFVDVNNIFLGSNADKGIGDYFSHYYSRLVLCKLDSALNVKWIKDYGGDAHYFLVSIKATHDGGCIMAAARYDYLTQNNETDPFVIKVDGNGNISWVYNLPDDFIKLTVYPNPGSNEMTVNNPPLHTKIILYDISGKPQKEQELDVNNNVNTEDLKAGIYFYQVTDDKGKVVAKGKWVKSN